MKTLKVLVKTMLLITSLALMTACGAQKSMDTSSTEQASREVIDSTTTTTKPVALCNRLAIDGFAANLMVYQTAVEGNNMRYTRMKITQVLASLANTGYGIRFYRWKVNNTTGKVLSDTVSLQFIFQSNSKYNQMGAVQEELNWASVKTIISNNSLGYTSLQSFLNDYTLTIDLRDPNGEYDGLQIVAYDSSNNAVMNQVMLVPAFYANPESYRYLNDGVTLRPDYAYNAHPFKSMTGQSWGDDHFVNEASSYCF